MRGEVFKTDSVGRDGMGRRSDKEDETGIVVINRCDALMRGCTVVFCFFGAHVHFSNTQLCNRTSGT